MEPEVFDERNKKLKMVDGPGRDALVVASADVEHKTAVVGEHPEDFTRKWQEPIDVPSLGRVPVLLLEVQRVWRRSHDEAYRFLRQLSQEFKRIGQVCGAKLSLEVRFSAKKLCRVCEQRLVRLDRALFILGTYDIRFGCA